MMRKGQAAMEFLMTYGWAILAAVIAIGVLVYLGVFSPGKMVQESCILSTPFGGCEDESFLNGTSNILSLTLTNGGAEDYVIDGVDVTNCIATPYVPTDATMSPGEKQTWAITCTTDPAVGAQVKAGLTINYHKSGLTRALTSTGNIVRKAVA